MVPEAHADGVAHVLFQPGSTPMKMWLELFPLEGQTIGKLAFVQVSQPLRMNPSPATGVCATVELRIPGRCCHGEDSLAPELLSLPLVEIK